MKHPKALQDSVQWFMCASKIRYSSRKAASKRLKKLRKRLRAYHCPYCNGWHLTKRKLKG